MDPASFRRSHTWTERRVGGGGGFPGGGLAFASLLPQLLMSFGPALLNKIFGKDPAKEFHKQVSRLTSAQNVGKLTNQFYNQNIGSPAYSQAQGTIAAGANAGAGQLAANLGRMEISDSGTGAVLSSLTPSIIGSQQAGLRTSAYTAGQQQAQQAIQAQLAALGQTQGQTSPTQQYFGAGLDAFGPQLQSFLRARFPQMFAQYGG
jgi:hypothetical protein